VRALCDRASFERALAQGYEPAGDKRRVDSVAVAGLAAPLDLVVIAE
jgi:hypothetical protein